MEGGFFCKFAICLSMTWEWYLSYRNKDNQAVAISASALAEIDMYNTLQVPLTKDFPIEDFFRVPFTHHVRIIEGTKDINALFE